MKFLIAFLFLLSLIGCSKAPVSIANTDNTEFKVAELFTHNGCTVNRFYDAGEYHYYTNCHGSTIGTIDCGKNCTRQDEISTQ